MTKITQIKSLKEFIKFESSKEQPDYECIEAFKKAIAEKEKALADEKLRVQTYKQVITQNKRKREEAYQNRKLIKEGSRESYRQRKIRLNKERRAKLAA